MHVTVISWRDDSAARAGAESAARAGAKSVARAGAEFANIEFHFLSQYAVSSIQ